MAIYIKAVTLGLNWNNKQGMRSKTGQGYLKAALELFRLRNFPLPVKINDKHADVNVILHNLEREEEIANQREPLTKEMFAAIIEEGKISPIGSKIWLICKFVILGRLVGPRGGEWAQKSRNKVDRHEYPGSGRKVVKAFTRSDFEFYDGRGQKITTFTQASKLLVVKLVIRWRIQKNRRNGQKVGFKILSKTYADMDSVLAAFDIYMRSIAIGQTDDLPMAAFLNNNKIEYVTLKDVSTFFQKIAKKVHPKLSKSEIQKYSSHSIRVWACVTLDEAGKSASFIKARLRWLGESFRTYLRDTNAIHEQHAEVAQKALAEVMAMLGSNIDESMTPQLIDEDDEMGEYLDE